MGQAWAGTSYPVEFYALGGQGTGIPIRVSITSFGPVLLSKVLGLNATQESCLGLVFHYADAAGLALLDLKDLRAVVSHLVSEEGKAELEGLGGLSKATAGVILRELIGFQDQGADVFFGEPEFDTSELLRLAADGRGTVSVLELPSLQDRPALFSTFLMWLLADLFQDLPEVGDVDKPKLVFFFDEAHLLFTDASKDFLTQVTQTVRLIRSKGVGVYFVTQTPKDVPGDVLAQLGNRVQHALRAFTPDDAKALRATVSTFPRSTYDLEEVLTQLGIGEAIVTVLSERGVPTPVAWTRLQAPQSLMAPTDAAVMQQMVAASPLWPKYGTAIDGDSAYELLTARLAAAQVEAAPAPTAPAPAPAPKSAPARREPESQTSKTVKVFAAAAATTLGREIVRGLFGTAKRKRWSAREAPVALIKDESATFCGPEQRSVLDRLADRRFVLDQLGADGGPDCYCGSAMAEDAGFEPARGCPLHAFQACALGHYANPPPRRIPAGGGGSVIAPFGRTRAQPVR